MDLYVPMVPGSHVQGVLSGDDIHQFAARIPSLECVVSKGGIFAMRPLLTHASSKSSPEKKRRDWHIEYAAAALLANGLRG
jgi:hypothetical protein